MWFIHWFYFIMEYEIKMTLHHITSCMISTESGTSMDNEWICCCCCCYLVFLYDVNVVYFSHKRHRKCRNLSYYKTKEKTSSSRTKTKLHDNKLSFQLTYSFSVIFYRVFEVFSFSFFVYQLFLAFAFDSKNGFRLWLV